MKVQPMFENTERITSRWLGEIHWGLGCELEFPAGLPGFEQETRIIPVEIPLQRPLIYLQSARQPDICFLALPVLAVCPEFELQLSDDDRSLLEFDSAADQTKTFPALGTDVFCLALLTPWKHSVQTNLDAPIVINLHNRRGIQAVSPSCVAGSCRLGEDGTWEAVC